MLARRIAYNTVAQTAGKLIGFLVSSFFLLILTARLGTEGVGWYTTVTAFVAFFVNLADFGINTVMMREIAQNQGREEEISARFLGFRFGYSLLMLSLAPLVALLIPQYQTHIIFGIAIAALTQFILMINQNFVSILQVKLQMDRAALAELSNRFVTLGLVIWAGSHVSSVTNFYYLVLWITALAALVNTLFSYWFARRHWPIHIIWPHGQWRAMFLLVTPMGIVGFLSIAHLKSDAVILSILKPSYDVGVYGYATKMAEILYSLPLLFLGIVFPRQSEVFKTNRPEFNRLTQKAFDVMTIVAPAFAVGTFMLAPYLTTMLSRQSLSDGLIAGRVLQFFAVSMIFWFFEALYRYALLAASDYRGLIRSMSVALIVNVVLNFMLIPKYSYYGAAAVMVLSGFIMMVLTIIYASRLTQFKAKFSYLFAVLTAGLVMAGSIWLMESLMSWSPVSFHEVGRLNQLLSLTALITVGGLGYLLGLSLWGQRSPLKEFQTLLQKSS